MKYTDFIVHIKSFAFTFKEAADISFWTNIKAYISFKEGGGETVELESQKPKGLKKLLSDPSDEVTSSG